jgi:hypothetical protein
MHLRSEVARLSAPVTKLNTAFGRRDIASVKALLESASRRDFEAAVRDRIHTVPLPDGTVLCRVLGRYKIYVDRIVPGAAFDAGRLLAILETAFLCRES